jgi:hypothetical protein
MSQWNRSNFNAFETRAQIGFPPPQQEENAIAKGRSENKKSENAERLHSARCEVLH